MDGKLFTSQQMADALQISKHKLLRLVSAGEIPVIRVGKRGLRYNPYAVVEALQAKPQNDALTKILASMKGES